MKNVVMTVNGLVDASEISRTLMHEHLFVDVTPFWESVDAIENGDTAPMTSDLGGIARWNANVVRDNLRFDPDTDYELIRGELLDFAVSAGAGACVVDLSTVPLGPYPDAVKRLSSDTGTHVVMGTGFYVDAAHPEWLRSATAERVEDKLESDIVDGFGASGVRAGIIGEIGTSATVTPSESVVLRAAARVGVRTGLTVNVHCEPPELAVVHGILDTLMAEGLPADRIYLSHLDEISYESYLVEVLDRGVVVGFDSFGQDSYFSPSWKSRSDLAKGAMLMRLIEAGFDRQLVLAQDICKKAHLKHFGGMGLDHVTSRVIPRLQATAALSDESVRRMLVETPRRLLAVGGSVEDAL